GLAQRGTTLRDYRDLNGLNGNYQGQAWVYGREGDPCRVCGTRIQRLKLAGRSAHFCPCCQPSPNDG
ncbi:MAG: zinc finger domain-containing protein, partial [Thermostichus sp. DG_1_6_bins_120]